MLVKNVGTRPGDEMVQLYGRTLAPRRPMPLKQLAGFARVPLAPGEERRVSFSLSPIQAFAYYDEARKAIWLNRANTRSR